MAFIDYEDTYVQPLILHALQNHFHPASYKLIQSYKYTAINTPTSPVLQITSYEAIDFTHLLTHPTTLFANAYMIRKALIRKHHLAHTVSAWCAKYPESPIKRHVKTPTLHLELDYAEFLDDALLEAFELHDSFARNEAHLAAYGGANEEEAGDGREWWILKPSMSDRGQGIRVFSSEDELRGIFEEWEVDSSESDLDSIPCYPAEAEIPEGKEGDEEGVKNINDENSALPKQPAGVITSQLRHFVVQPYIHPPLLFPVLGNRKFHLRSYVLALGALRVYLYEEMLALFAPLPYAPPSASASSFDPRVHLTNTCLQSPPSKPSPNITTAANSITDSKTIPLTLFSSLPSALPTDPNKTWKTTTANAIALATSELFLAAARTQSTHFQPLPNSFEVFGLDWIVDSSGHVWLLEVNAFPDFAQSGVGVGKEVVRGLWEGVLGVVGMRWLSGGNVTQGGIETKMEARWGMKKVLDVDLGRR